MNLRPPTHIYTNTIMRGFLTAALAGLASLVTATTTTTTTTVTLTIPPSAALANPHLLPPATRATLTTLYTTYAAPLTAANTFVFGNVTAGSYLADVHCATHAFAPLRIDVVVAAAHDAAEAEAATAAAAATEQKQSLVVRAWETFRGNDWNNKGEAVREVIVAGRPALPVRVLGAKGYFVERGSFSVLSILKNPMILLAIVSMGLFFVMPKLVDNMDPEMRAEFEAQQKSNPMSSLMGGGGGAAAANPMGSFDMASFLAGSKKDEGGAPAVEGGNNGGNGGKKSRK